MMPCVAPTWHFMTRRLIRWRGLETLRTLRAQDICMKGGGRGVLDMSWDLKRNGMNPGLHIANDKK